MHTEEPSFCSVVVLFKLLPMDDEERPEEESKERLGIFCLVPFSFSLYFFISALVSTFLGIF